MKSPLAAFLWQEWRLSWVATVSITAAAASFSLLCYRLDGNGETAGRATSLLLAVLASVSILLRSGGRESQTMPRFFLTLPVKSGFWASVHFAYGIGILVVAGIALTSFHSWLFGAKAEFMWGPVPPLWKVALCLAAFAGVLEGILTLVRTVGSPLLTAAALAMTVILFSAVTGSVALRDWMTQQPAVPPSRALKAPQPVGPAVGGSIFGEPTSRNGLGGRGRGPGEYAAPRPIPSQPSENTNAEARRNPDAAPTEVIPQGPPSQGGPLPELAMRRSAPERGPIERGVSRRRAPLLPWIWATELFFGYSLSCVGVMLYRHGAASLTRNALLISVLRRGRRDKQRFSSPESAEIWLEWRRFGRYLPLTSSILIMPILVFLCTGTGIMHGDLIMLFIMPMIVSVSGLAVYMTLRRHWDHTTGLDAFLFTLPVTTRTMATARLKMAAYSITCTLIIAVAILLTFHLGPTNIHGILWGTPYGNFIAVLLIAAGIWILFWFALPAGYSIILLAIVSGLASEVFNLRSRDDFGPLVIALAVLIAVPSLVIFRKAHKAGLLLTRGMAGMFVFSLATTVCAYLANDSPNDIEDTILLLCVALISPLPFATVPLSIRWCRHR